MTICIDCKGEIVTGPINECRVTVYNKDGPRQSVEVRCEDCAHRLGLAMWDHDEQGQYRWPIHADPVRTRQ